VALFIHPNWVAFPGILSPLLIFEGDNRSFSSSRTASYRMQSTVGIANPATSNVNYFSSPSHSIGQTRMYDKATSLTNGLNGGTLTATAKADTVKGFPMKLDWRTATARWHYCNTYRRGPNPSQQTSQNQTNCVMAAADPLIPGAPDVEIATWLTLDCGNNQVRWILQGCTSYWPHFECYLGNTGIYLNNDSGNTYNIMLRCTEHVDRSGSI